MEIITTTLLSNRQFCQINQLWNEEYPVKLKDRFPILLDEVVNYNHYIIQDENSNIIAWAVDFEKQEQIRFSLIVASQHQANGIGGLLLNKLKLQHKELYGWVIDHNDDLKANGEKYKSPMPFYQKNGFEILHDKRIDNEMIKAVLIKWKNNH